MNSEFSTIDSIQKKYSGLEQQNNSLAPDFSSLPKDVIALIFQEFFKLENLENINRAPLKVCKTFKQVGSYVFSKLGLPANFFRATITTEFFLSKINGDLQEIHSILQFDPRSQSLRDELPKVDPAANDNEAIRVVSANGYIKAVKILLMDERVNPAAKDNEAIRMASANGHIKVVKKLLKDGRVDPAAKDNEALRMAHTNGHREVAEKIIRQITFHKHLFNKKISTIHYGLFLQNILTCKEQPFCEIDQTSILKSVDEQVELYLKIYPNLHDKDCLPSLKFVALCMIIEAFITMTQIEKGLKINDVELYQFLPLSLKKSRFSSPEEFLEMLNILKIGITY